MHCFHGRQTARLYRAGAVCALLLLLSSFALPVNASPPRYLQFTIQVTYALGNFTTVSGSWHAGGLVASAGNATQHAHHAGWPGDGGQFKTAHLTTILSDGVGTITIKDQQTMEWEGNDPTGIGHWIITGGTGSYAGLHGRGDSNSVTAFHFTCPAPSVSGPCLIAEMQFTGEGHVD